MLSTLTSSYLAALDFCLLEFSLMSLSVAGSSYLKKKRTYRQLLVIYINSIILEHYLCLDWTITTWPETTNITNPKLLQAYYCFSFST